MQKNKNWALLTLSGIALLSSSCAMFGERKPSSERETMLAQIYSEVNLANNTVGVDLAACKTSFDNLYQKLFNIAGSSVYFDATDIKSIDEDIQNSFETRLALKDSLKKIAGKSSADLGCLASAQDVFKALRYVEDYLVEVRMDKANNAPTEYVTLKGDFPYLLVNPKYVNDFKSYEDLKSGDTILSRGNAYSSAAIARIGKSDYQFSHLSFVYRDADTKELYTTEAHIEIGSVTNPFIEHINEKNARSVVFRYKNEDIAAQASKISYDHVKKYQDAGKSIDYDFSMNYQDDSKLFCSEVVSYGFKKAMPDHDYIPKFKTHFSSGMIPFLNTIGVPVNKDNIVEEDVFAPGDIQFDPNFDLVAEWRNPKKMEESRYKDFILTKMFERMEQGGYQIDPGFKMTAEAKSFWLLRRLPVVKKFLEKRFSLSMNTAQMELFMALDKIGDAFYKNLELRSIEFDHPMTPKEIYAALDEFIKKDYDQWMKYKKGDDLTKPMFHLFFHP